MATGFLAAIGLIPNALIAPPGTRLLFNNTAVPLGWTQEVGAAFNDTSVRTVTGAGGGSAGSTTWGTWNFGGTFNVNTFTISTAQLPAHNHAVTDPGHGHGISDPGHTHCMPGSSSISLGSGPSTVAGHVADQPCPFGTGSSATGISVNGAGSNISIQNTGSGSGIQPSYTTPNVKYSDYIIGVKA